MSEAPTYSTMLPGNLDDAILLALHSLKGSPTVHVSTSSSSEDSYLLGSEYDKQKLLGLMQSIWQGTQSAILQIQPDTTAIIRPEPITWVDLDDSDNFSIVISKVFELIKSDEDENPGAVKPTEYALSTTLDLLFKTYELSPIGFPKASADTDESGGLHLYWRSPQRRVHLTISAHQEGLSFIYHSEGSEYVAEPNVSPANLAYWLNWYKEAV